MYFDRNGLVSLVISLYRLFPGTIYMLRVLFCLVFFSFFFLFGSFFFYYFFFFYLFFMILFLLSLICFVYVFLSLWVFFFSCSIVLSNNYKIYNLSLTYLFMHPFDIKFTNIHIFHIDNFYFFCTYLQLYLHTYIFVHTTRLLLIAPMNKL